MPGVGAPSSIEKEFTVAAGEKYALAAELKSGQTISGDFSISGEENYIDFYIKDPSGSLTYGVVRAVGSHSFAAKANNSGAHTFYFDNSFSWGASRQVTLRYRLR